MFACCSASTPTFQCPTTMNSKIIPISNDKSHLQRFTFQRKIGEGSSAVIMLAYDKVNGKYCCCKIIPKSQVSCKSKKEQEKEDSLNGMHTFDENYKYDYNKINSKGTHEKGDEDGDEKDEENENDDDDNSAIDIRHLMCEVETLKKLNHPNIAYFIDFVEDEANFYLFQEYCDGVTLLDFINSRLENEEEVDENEVKCIMSQILQTLVYLHSHNIAHRDLKPENIIVLRPNNFGMNQDQPGANFSVVKTTPNNFDTVSFQYRKNAGLWKIKIVDFGLSSASGTKTLLSTFCGSLHYAAPEVIQQKPYVGDRADIWSAGVIMYTLLANKFPFDDENVTNIIVKIISANYEVPDVSFSAQKLIRAMLTPDPEERITADEALNSSYFIQPRQPQKCVIKSMPAMPAMTEIETEFILKHNTTRTSADINLFNTTTLSTNRNGVKTDVMIRRNKPNSNLQQPKKVIVKPMLPSKWI
ncbi:hypothetical protein TRFO_02047 [Tritrichomonas foetus]|uniref:Protein kinase domain-containing protein n=1 Tax=Tritrichomonas foetus TaxID=1144522 RepID=A0A1J4JHG4_9EUKA|nr:hypothetical protein TRFO_02047 [Tritrichomonas foetus]|eukprot:OHS96925.1 hypothetical protein TRFO_02047 [Tritrichomonas foetus]